MIGYDREGGVVVSIRLSPKHRPTHGDICNIATVNSFIGQMVLKTLLRDLDFFPIMFDINRDIW